MNHVQLMVNGKTILDRSFSGIVETENQLMDVLDKFEWDDHILISAEKDMKRINSKIDTAQYIRERENRLKKQYVIESGPYREIEPLFLAFRWFGSTDEHVHQAMNEIEQFCKQVLITKLNNSGDLVITNKYGYLQTVSRGNWVVIDEYGDIDVMSDSIFNLKFEAV